ncbi:hypothetical protein ELY33_17465, partial [Vreelandella andesensis]
AITRDGDQIIKVATTPALTADSLTINNGGPVINNAGINMGGNQITNLAPGLNPGEAANVDQLTQLVEGNNTILESVYDPTTGQTTYKVNADGTTVSAGSTAVTVAATGPDANNVTDYAVDLSQDAKDSLVLADSSIQEVVTQIDGTDVKTLTKTDNNANFVTGKNIKLADDGVGGIKVATADDVEFTNVNSDTMTVVNGDSIANAGGATNYITEGNTSVVNGGDVYTAINTTEQQYTGDNGAVIVKRNPNEVLTVKGGATTSTENNILTEADLDGSIAVKLAETIDLGTAGSVKMGDTFINNKGLAITGGPSITKTGIDAGNTVITNVAPGEISDTSTDAVNGSQLFATNQNVTNNTTDITNNTTDIGNNTTNITNNTTDIGNNTTNIASNTTNIASNTTDIANNTTDITNNTTNIGNNTTDIAKGFNIAADNSGYADPAITEDNVQLGETVTYTSTDGNIVTTFGLNDNQIDFSLASSINVGTTNTVTIDGDAGTIGGLTNQTFDPNNFTSGQAASEDQLKQVSDVANSGWNLTANGEATGENIAPGESADFSAGQNIAITRNGNSIEVATTPALTADSLTINNGGPVINDNGIDMGDNQITNLGSGLGGQELGDVAGDDLKNAVNVGDLQDVSTADNGGGFGLADTSGAEVKKDLGQTIKVTDPDGNIITTADNANGELQLSLGDDLTVGGKDGKDGYIGVDGADGVSGVAINGKDGTIGLTGPSGKNGTIGIDGTNGSPGINGTDGITRIVYEDGEGNDYEVATMDDGLKFKGNKGDTIAKKLGETLNIEGELADTDAASGANLRVDSDGTKLNLVMAKNLTDLDSITINNGGPVINDNGIDMGDNQITNLGSGLGGQELGDVTGDDLKNAVNVGDLQNSTTGLIDKGFNIAADNGADDNVKLGETVAYRSEDGNVITTVTDNQIDFGLNSDLVVGGPGKDGAPGVDGTIGVNGADGVSGVTINGADGSIGLNGKDGANGTITVTDGAPGVDGKDGITRIVIDDIEVATLEDGLKFVGDDGKVVERKLNETLSLTGGADETALTDNNIGITQDGDGGLKVQLAKNLTGLENVTSNNLTVTNETRLGDNFFVNNEGNVTYEGEITEDNHITNKQYVDNSVSEVADTPLTFGANEGDDSERRLGDRLDIVGEADEEGNSNIITKLTDEETLELALNDDLKIGNSITVGEGGPVISGDGIDMGDNKITNVADGDVSADSKDAINGSQLYQLESIVTNVTGDVSNEYVTNNGLGIRYVRTNDSGLAVSDAFAKGEGSTAVGYEAVASADRALAMGYEAVASHQGSVALGAGARTAEVVRTSSVEIAGETYQFAGAGEGVVSTVSVGSAGAERTVTNVAAGRITAESTDAINGSQLYATNQAVGALDNRVTNVEGDISNITNDLADLDDRAVKYDRNDDNSVDYTTITLEGDGGTTITNVAPGEIAQNSTDAVNGSQLWEVSNQITNIEQGGSKYFRANSEGAAADPQGADSIAMGPSSVAAGDRSVASGAGAQAKVNGSVALGADSVADREGMNGERERFSNESVASTQGAVSVGSAGNERQITNVAGGTRDTDAVNVRQLDAVQRGAVNYDRDEDGNVDYSTIILKGDEGTTITNVAPGVNETDAVNVGQMNDLSNRFSQEIHNVHGRIDSVERNANAGSASAIAASTVPQAWMPGKSMVGVGAGTYGGESAVSVGVSRLSDNGRWVIQGKITGDSQSNFGAGIGAGWHW